MPPPAGPCVSIWGLRAAHAPYFWGHQAPRAMVALWLHASCPKTAKKRQNPKNSQPQGPSGKKVLAPATNCKNWPGTLVGMPQQGFGRQGQCCKPGGLPGGCHLDLCIFLGWAAFHGNFLLWAASMPPCQCACPQSWVRPKVCSLGW